GGDGAAYRLRYRDRADHGPGRARARAEPCDANAPAINPAGARSARPALRLPRLRPSADLVRRAPPCLVDQRRPDDPAKPGALMPTASSNGPRRRLGTRTQGRTIQSHATDEARDAELTIRLSRGRPSTRAIGNRQE